MSAEIIDGRATMKVRVRLSADGDYIVRDTDECAEAYDMDEPWNEQGYTSPFRDFVIEINAALPRDPVVEAVVDIPDEPVLEPATASVAA